MKFCFCLDFSRCVKDWFLHYRNMNYLCKSTNIVLRYRWTVLLFAVGLLCGISGFIIGRYYRECTKHSNNMSKMEIVKEILLEYLIDFWQTLRQKIGKSTKDNSKDLMFLILGND